MRTILLPGLGILAVCLVLAVCFPELDKIGQRTVASHLAHALLYRDKKQSVQDLRSHLFACSIRISIEAIFAAASKQFDRRPSLGQNKVSC